MLERGTDGGRGGRGGSGGVCCAITRGFAGVADVVGNDSDWLPAELDGFMVRSGMAR